MGSNKLRISVASLVFLAALAFTAPARANSSVSFEFFHSSLAPHGSWHFSASFGQVWHPYVEEGDWHPYGYGHWVYSDFGWTWVSAYEWGAIPFHYGTWVIEPGVGWVWVPGYVWAPAWVVYRTGPSYIGWAPVPPSFSVGVSFRFDDYYEPDYFVFVPDRHFCDRRIDRWAYPASRSRVIYNQTTIIHNNITIDNDVVVNRGLDYRRIERVAARRPERMSIESVPRVAPTERVNREMLRDNPRQALRIDPRHAERGRVRVVADEVRRDERPRDARRSDTTERDSARWFERSREPDVNREHAQRGRERAVEPERERERAVVEPRERAARERAHREDVVRDEDRARRDERVLEERRGSEQRDRRERADRDRQERAQQARDEEARSRREQERARDHAARIEGERAARDQERQTRREQERAVREQQRSHEQERAARGQEQQMRREQEHSMREQQRSHEQDRAREQEQPVHREQQQRGNQERARQRRSQEQEGPQTAPDDQQRGHGHGRDW